MRNMRKAAAVLLATGMVFALTACGGNKKVENTVNSIDDLEERASVYSLEQPAIFMHLIMKVTRQALRLSVIIKEQMLYRH